LRSDGDILLLSTYELGHQPHLLTLALGFLSEAGFQPRALDLSVQKLDEAAVKQARLVAIAVPMHTALRLGLRAAERVRSLNPSVTLAFYGLYAPLNEALLRARGASLVLGGEAEEALVEAARRLERGLPPQSGPDVLLDRLRFVLPRRDLLPALDRYAKLRLPDGEERLTGYVEASRGCKHLCRHCPVPAVYGGRFFVVSEDILVEDVRRQVAAGARHITFGDPDFLNGPQHALRVLRALHVQFPSLTFDFTAKIEHLLAERDRLPELAALGCIFIVSAVESLSARVLDLLDKGHSAADVDAAVTAVRAAGMTLRPSLMPFTPWSTLADYLELLQFIETREMVGAVDPVQLTIRLLLPPGSLLLALPEVQAIIGPLDETRLTYPWVHPDPRMDALQAAVSSLCGARPDDPPEVLFPEIVALARTAAELPPAIVSIQAQPSPRLTEHWFCCAEPTDRQMGLASLALAGEDFVLPACPSYGSEATSEAASEAAHDAV